MEKRAEFAADDELWAVFRCVSAKGLSPTVSGVADRTSTQGLSRVVEGMVASTSPGWIITQVNHLATHADVVERADKVAGQNPPDEERRCQVRPAIDALQGETAVVIPWLQT